MYKLKTIMLSISLLILLVMTTGCTKINDQNISKIKTGMSRDKVVSYIGRPDEEIPYLTGTQCLWFDNANTLEGAIKKAQKNKKIRYVNIYFGYELNKVSYVLSVDSGYIDQAWIEELYG